MGMRHCDRWLGRILLFVFLLVFLIPPAFAKGSLRIGRAVADQKGRNLEFRVAYPRISGMSNREAQKSLNVEFLERAEAAQARAVLEARTGAVTGGVDFTVTRNGGGVASLVMEERIGRGGRVAQRYTGATFDTVSGRRFLLCDLFCENADYVATLSGQVNGQIARQKLDTGQGRERFRRIGANSPYYLTADALVLFFAQGEYFSDAVGVKEFAIPLATLDGILKPQFVIRS